MFLQESRAIISSVLGAELEILALAALLQTIGESCRTGNDLLAISQGVTISHCAPSTVLLKLFFIDSEGSPMFFAFHTEPHTYIIQFK